MAETRDTRVVVDPSLCKRPSLSSNLTDTQEVANGIFGLILLARRSLSVQG